MLQFLFREDMQNAKEGKGKCASFPYDFCSYCYYFTEQQQKENTKGAIEQIFRENGGEYCESLGLWKVGYGIRDIKITVPGTKLLTIANRQFRYKPSNTGEMEFAELTPEQYDRLELVQNLRCQLEQALEQAKAR